MKTICRFRHFWQYPQFISTSVKTEKSTSLAIILESGEPREVHHFATLLGYGASAINPYLALETIHELIDSHMLEKDYYAAVDDYNHAVISGIVKIASKMGISTIQSYQGSQIFEAIGISSDVIEKYFTGTVSRVGGITLEDIEENVEKLHSEAFDPLGLPTDLTLDSVGAHKMRTPGRGTSLQSSDYPSSAAVHMDRKLRSVQTVHRSGR